jgi:hypothetical protein
MMRSLLRRLRGALGLGVFGSLASVAFGSFVKTLSFLLHGTPLGLPGSLVPLATGGFVAGLLASLGFVAASRGGRAPDGARVFLMGVPVAAVAVLMLRGDVLVRAGAPGLVAFAVFVAVGGSVIGLVGTAALKIAEAAPDEAPALADPPGDGGARRRMGGGPGGGSGTASTGTASNGTAAGPVANPRDAPV